MSAQRSMTDEQMLAKYGYDKEPWVDPDFPGWRGPEPREPFTDFAPRPECIPSRDETPWRCGKCGHRLSFRGGHDGVLATWKPRAFVGNPIGRPPVNPILARMREQRPLDFEMWAWAFGSYDMFGGYTTWINPAHEFYSFVIASRDQIEFARTVLTRLAALTAVSS